jgi:hypothetical protein
MCEPQYGFRIEYGAISRAFNVPKHARRQEKIAPTIADRLAQLHLTENNPPVSLQK